MWRNIKIWVWRAVFCFCVSETFAQTSLKIPVLSEEVVAKAAHVADSLLKCLSIKEQLAQLLLLPAKQVALQQAVFVKYGLGAVLSTDSVSMQRFVTPHHIPISQARYWKLFPEESTHAALLLRSVRDTTFVRHFARLQALRFHKSNTSVLYVKKQEPLYLDSDSTLQAYTQGLADLGVVFTPRLTLVEEATAEEAQPFFYTHDLLQGINYLSKKLSKDMREQYVRNILTHKYLQQHVQRKYATTHVSVHLERQWLLPRTLTLLNHQKQLVPIQGLDTLDMAFVALHSSPSTFKNRLADYVQADTYREEEILTSLNSYNTLLVTLGEQAIVDPKVYIKRVGLLRKLQTSGKKLIIVCFGENTLKKYALLPQVDVLLFSPSTYADAQDMSVQALFGAISIRGQLPFSIPNYSAGTGIQTKTNATLSFVAPEVLGIDREELYRRVEAIIWEGLEGRAFPGCQVLAAQHGKVFFYEHYGYHTYTQARAVSATSIYDLASLTKVMGATTALMKLYEEEKFSLQATLSDYFPKWKKKPAGHLIFKNILSHHTGLPSWIPYYKEMFRKNGKWKNHFLSNKPSRRHNIGLTDDMYVRANFRKQIYSMISEAELGKQEYVYSGLIFYLMPELIKKLSHRPYEQYINEHFFAPIGAKSIKFTPLQYFSAQDIAPTEDDTFFRHALLHGVVHDEGAALMDGISGHAGLFGRAIDVAKIWQMYLQRGFYGGQQYLKPEVIDKFTYCHFCHEDNRRGLGFDKPPIHYIEGESSVAAQASAQSFGHTGFTGVIAWADPESGLLFIFLCNRVHPTRDNTRIYELNLRPRLHQVFYELINTR